MFIFFSFCVIFLCIVNTFKLISGFSFREMVEPKYVKTRLSDRKYCLFIVLLQQPFNRKVSFVHDPLTFTSIQKTLQF